MMKKLTVLVSILLTAVVGCISAAADGVVPATGEQVRALPFVLIGIAVVVIAALLLLPIFTKKK